jgi:hypothetical protein
MRFHWFSLVIVICAMPLVSPAGEPADHPFKKAKIGDYVLYKATTSFNGMDREMIVKHTVSAKSEKEATMQTITTYEFMGKTVNKAEPDVKIDLTTPFDSITDNLKKGKWEKTGNGKEKIKVGDKTYDCTWATAKREDVRDGKKTETEIKIWSAKSVPLTGVVKREVKSAGINQRMEITGSGSAK